MGHEKIKFAQIKDHADNKGKLLAKKSKKNIETF